MYNPKLSNHTVNINNYATTAAQQQNAVEMCHYMMTQLGSKSGRPVILPYATPFVEQLLDAQGLALLPEGGAAPLIHFVVHAELAKQMSRSAAAGENIEAQIHGVVISENCYALLYQFEIGEQSRYWIFDASDPSTNRAFCRWLEQGYIPAAISSPVSRGVVEFPCRTQRNWRPFMDRAANANDGAALPAQVFLEKVMEVTSVSRLVDFDHSEFVLGTSLQQMLSPAPDMPQDDDLPAVY